MFPEWKNFEDHSYPYLTGNGFSVQCQYVWNYDGFKINPNYKFLNWVYVKTDHIHDFFNTVKLKEPFVLLTGNSDLSINESHLKFINDSRVLFWFGQNVEIEHPKVKTIPIGIANYGYPFADINILNKVRSQNNNKTNMFYCNFTVDTNKAEREYCLQQTKIQLVDHKNGGWDGVYGCHGMSTKVANTFEEYLTDISRSYFCISPKGNGSDCHRTWEALYVKTIPIVTKTIIAKQHLDFPILILDDWSDFKNIKFDKKLYDSLWNNFDTDQLTMPKYLKRIITQINENIAH
jgi:hypothetical protein